jgi:hypothetical protein
VLTATNDQARETVRSGHSRNASRRQATITGTRQKVVLPEDSVGMVERIAPVIRASAVANTHTVVRRNDRTDPKDGSGLTVLAGQLDLLPAINATSCTANGSLFLGLAAVALLVGQFLTEAPTEALASA